MQQLKLIIIFILFPQFVLANLDEGNDAIAKVIGNGASILDAALHYKIFTFDNQHITIENIIIGLFSLVIGLKTAKYASTFLKRN